MKPRGWNVGSDYYVPAFRTDHFWEFERFSSRTLIFLSSWNYSLSKASCYICFGTFGISRVLSCLKIFEIYDSFFGLVTLVFETTSSEDRTEPTSDSLYCFCHWQTRKFDWFMGRLHESKVSCLNEEQYHGLSSSCAVRHHFVNGLVTEL